MNNAKSRKTRLPAPKNRQALQVGELGEKFVQETLQAQGGKILASRWRCRWGELDLVVVYPKQKELSLVEVKTRQQNSTLDQQGLLAITPQKQRKLIRAALQYLATFPVYEDYGCRFDVALVTYRKMPNQVYQFKLAQYLEGAFEAEY